MKTSEGGEQRGVDVHKQTSGRKRHLIVDTLGLILLVLVHSASWQDAAGGYQTLQGLFQHLKGSVHNRWCRLKLIWADGAYTHIAEAVRKHFGWKLSNVLIVEKVFKSCCAVGSWNGLLVGSVAIGACPATLNILARAAKP